jgi:hypothetical protein
MPGSAHSAAKPGRYASRERTVSPCRRPPKAVNQIFERLVEDYADKCPLRLAAAALASTTALASEKDDDEFKFKLVRNTQFDAQFPNFAPNASGRVKIESIGPVEIMDVQVEGLPPNTDFDFFVIQVPHAPFGLTWYQGDIETISHGVGHGRFIGRFNIETFIVATGVAPAPLVFNDSPFPDAPANPKTNPVQLYHWVCGSTRHRTQQRLAVRTPLLHSTASTMLAFKCSIPAISLMTLDPCGMLIRNHNQS